MYIALTGLSQLGLSDALHAREGGERASALQILCGCIAPPASISGPSDIAFRPPISFGPQADQMLAVKAVTLGELWSVLQVVVHAKDVGDFVHHFTAVLGHKFTSLEAGAMYGYIHNVSHE